MKLNTCNCLQSTTEKRLATRMHGYDAKQTINVLVSSFLLADEASSSFSYSLPGFCGCEVFKFHGAEIWPRLWCSHFSLDPALSSRKISPWAPLSPSSTRKTSPAPSADDIELTTVKPFCAYVREYGGFSNIEKVETRYKELVNGLNYRGLMTSTPTCFILLHTTLLSSFSTVTMRSGW